MSESVIHHDDAVKAPSMPVQVGIIGRRSVARAFRRPMTIIPPLLFPTMLLLVNSAGLADAPKLPGFPADSYVDFALVITFLQGSLFATTTAGLGLGRDIEEGFLDRLALTPLSGTGLVLGELGGATAVGFFASIYYIVLGTIMGVEFQSGLGGMAVLLLLAIATAFAFAAVGAFLALRAGNAEAVQGVFPVLFAALFLSTMIMPLDLMEAGWFKVIATINPVSYLINGMRGLIITGWNWDELFITLLVVTAIIAAALAGCAAAIKTRMTRT